METTRTGSLCGFSGEVIPQHQYQYRPQICKLTPGIPRPSRTCAVQDLDEVQAHILLKRWVGPGNTLPPAGLTAAQCAELADLYARERMCLLKATETLLWLGEGGCGL